jgi:hypothetical protein
MRAAQLAIAKPDAMKLTYTAFLAGLTRAAPGARPRLI